MDPTSLIPKPDDGLSVGDIISKIIVPIALVVWGVITYLWRRAAAAQQGTIDATQSKMATTIETAKTLLNKDIESLQAAQLRAENLFKEVSDDVKLTRDKWEGFLKEYYSLDTTRSNKLEAAFRRVDELKTTMGELRPAMMRKLEENLTTMRNELRDDMRMYVRDQIADLKRSLVNGK